MLRFIFATLALLGTTMAACTGQYDSKNAVSTGKFQQKTGMMKLKKSQTVQFNLASCPAGEYSLQVYYTSGKARPSSVFVNSKTVNVNMPKAKKFGLVESVVQLKTGTNIVEISAAGVKKSLKIDSIVLTRGTGCSGTSGVSAASYVKRGVKKMKGGNELKFKKIGAAVTWKVLSCSSGMYKFNFEYSASKKLTAFNVKLLINKVLFTTATLAGGKARISSNTIEVPLVAGSNEISIEYVSGNGKSKPSIYSMFLLANPAMPTDMPSVMPSVIPSVMPSVMPTDIPTVMSTGIPSDMPSDMPTEFC